MHYYTSLFAFVSALVLPTNSIPTSPRDNITGDTASYSAVSISGHNTHRQIHSAANLTWDLTLSGYAATTASRCVLGIDLSAGNGGYNQNFDIQGATNFKATDSPATFASKAVTDWYSQEKNFATYYGEASPPPPTSSDKQYSGFTQMVWKGSQKLGCASYFCAQGTIPSFMVDAWITVCNYSPAGNMGGEYADNVSQS